MLLKDQTNENINLDTHSKLKRILSKLIPFSKLKRILSKVIPFSKLKTVLKKSFPDKKITVTDNKDGSQTILIR